MALARDHARHCRAWVAVLTLRDQLRRDEGVVPYAYVDSLGFTTIGVGRLIDQRKGGRLSDDEIDYLLANDIKRHTDELLKALPWVSLLDDARKGVLINMAFNLGVPGLLGFANTLAMVKAGDYSGAADNMLKSKWASQVGNRAMRLSQQMRSGQWV